MGRIVHNRSVARRLALAGSLAVHGAIALSAVVALTHTREPSPASAPSVAVEVVPSPRPTPPVVARGGPPADTPAPAQHVPFHARADVSRARSSTVGTAHPAPPAASTQFNDDRFASPSDGDAGDGHGGGHGRGIGFGDGGRIDSGGAGGQVAQLTLPAPEPVARRSKARPPRLIYPARDREADESQLFVAQVTIDAEGYVVGAHLLRGARSRADQRAEQAVWRFRYSPALDDDGRPTAATIEQPFLVE
jgi:hypothetical protein